jgi:hypothetical protein
MSDGIGLRFSFSSIRIRKVIRQLVAVCCLLFVCPDRANAQAVAGVIHFADGTTQRFKQLEGDLARAGIQVMAQGGYRMIPMRTVRELRYMNFRECGSEYMPQACVQICVTTVTGMRVLSSAGSIAVRQDDPVTGEITTVNHSFVKYEAPMTSSRRRTINITYVELFPIDSRGQPERYTGTMEGGAANSCTN